MLTCGGQVCSNRSTPGTRTPMYSNVGTCLTNRLMSRFIMRCPSSEFAEIMFPPSAVRTVQLYSVPSVSSAHRPVRSLCVVITVSAPIHPATHRASSFAPPTCPDRTGMAYRPVLSIHTTAGSVCLSAMKGAMLRTQIPMAPIKIKAS